MDTIKPFSTIGYNTEDFLKERLAELSYQYPDLFFAYIYHRDEKDKKDHYHLYLEPNTRVRDTDFQRIRAAFEQADPAAEGAAAESADRPPLGCMPFRKSKFDDWYLYAIHNREYLESKRLKKSTYDYDPTLVITNNPTDLKTRTDEIDTFALLPPIIKMQWCKDQGLSLRDALAYLRIPYSGMYGFSKLWETLKPDE